MPYNFYWNGIETNSYQLTQTEEIKVLAVSEFACEFTDGFFVYFSGCDPTVTNVITPNVDWNK